MCDTVQNYSKLIDLVMQIELTLSNFNATILKFSEKYQHTFSHVFIFGSMFPDSRGFGAVPIKRSNNLVSLH